jgi:hypothetical protein
MILPESVSLTLREVDAINIQNTTPNRCHMCDDTNESLIITVRYIVAIFDSVMRRVIVLILVLHSQILVFPLLAPYSQIVF